MRKAVDVLVFDSGVGGLSVLQAIRTEMPDLRFCFVADNAGLPYGKKEASWLVQRVNGVISAALDQVEPRVIVIACNTASTVVLPSLRARCSMPIVGVVPAIKPAAQLTKKKCIGLLATPATVQRAYTDSLIQEFAAGCQVVRVGSSRLVDMAEEKMRGVPLSMDELRTICEPFTQDPQPDVIVLGCTHFPLLQKELHEILPGVSCLDSGHAIAKRVKGLLPRISTAHRGESHEIAYFTAFDASIETLGSSLRAFGLNDSRALNLPRGIVQP